MYLYYGVYMNYNKVIAISVGFIAVVIFGLLLKELESFMRPFFIAVLLLFILMPFIKYFDRLKVPFALSFVFLMIFVLIIFGFFSFIVSNQVVLLANDLTTSNFSLNNFVSDVDEFLYKFNYFEDKITISYFLSDINFSKLLSSYAGTLLVGIGLFFSELFIVIIFLIFLIPSYKIMSCRIEALFDRDKIDKYRDVLVKIEKNVLDYLYAKSIVSFGTAFVSAIILILFGSDYVILFAMLIFILNFIPNIGSVFAVIIAVLFYFVKFGFVWNFIVLLVLLTTVQMWFGNYFEPKFAGKKLSLSPILIIFSLFIWYYIWGVVGMILAIPITSVIKIIVEHAYGYKKLAKLIS
jgi:AI-2 transport protein TqsA